MTADVGSLARAVKARRLELGLAQGDLAERGGPSLVTVRQVEMGRQGTFRGLTLAGLDRALLWEHGSAERILRGEAPTALPDNMRPDSDSHIAVYGSKGTGKSSIARQAEERPVGLGLDEEADGLPPEQVEAIRSLIRSMKAGS